MKCIECDGEGGWRDIECYCGGPYCDCHMCGGTGKISLWFRLKWLFWDYAPVGFIEWWDARKEEA